MSTAANIGIDIGKCRFHMHGQDNKGADFMQESYAHAIAMHACEFSCLEQTQQSCHRPSFWSWQMIKVEPPIRIDMLPD